MFTSWNNKTIQSSENPINTENMVIEYASNDIFGDFTGLSTPYQHVANKVIFQNANAFQTWHERLGHPRIRMMRKLSAIPLVVVYMMQNSHNLRSLWGYPTIVWTFKEFHGSNRHISTMVSCVPTIHTKPCIFHNNETCY